MTVNVAVIGAHGNVSGPTIKALTDSPFSSSFTHPITVLTRDASKEKSTDKVKYVDADFGSKDSVAKALKGIDTVVDVSSVAYDKTHLLEGIAAAGVKVFFPSEYGVQYDVSEFAPAFHVKSSAVTKARSLGLKTVLVRTGLFYEFTDKAPGLVQIGDDSYGELDGGRVTGVVTKLSDIGLSLASLASRPASELKDAYYVAGDKVTQATIVSRYEKKHSVKLTAKPLTVDSVVAPAKEALKKTGDGSVFYLVLQAVYALGEFSYTVPDDNDDVTQGKFKFTPYSDF